MKVSPAFDAVAPPVIGVGVTSGLGDPAGLGLGNIPELFAQDLAGVRAEQIGLKSTPIAIPAPTMTTTRATTAAMIIIHGVRCTGGCGPTELGE